MSGKVRTEFPQHGIDQSIDDWDEDDDRQGVDILHDVVRDAVELHCAGLRYEVVQHLLVTHPEDRVVPA